MRRIAIVAVALALIGYAGLGIHTIVSKQHQLDVQEVKLKTTTSQINDLQLKYDQVNSTLNTELHKNTTDEQKVKQLESEKQDLQKAKDDLESQLQSRADAKAKADALASKAFNVVTGTATASAQSSGGYMTGCGDNASAAFIYGQESGGRVTGRCNPSAVNAGGCSGIGQACPGSKLGCGADYACQNAYFNQYAINRYGSWAAAESFWRANGWW